LRRFNAAWSEISGRSSAEGIRRRHALSGMRIPAEEACPSMSSSSTSIEAAGSTRMRIVVADPVPIVRSGVRRILAGEKDFSVGVVGDLDELLSAVARRRVDVALVDLDLPPEGGIAAIQRLADLEVPHRIVWSVDADAATVLSAVRAGATGYLDKELQPRSLLRCLRGLDSGEAALTRALAARLIDAVHGLDERQRIQSRARLLSCREREVLELIARGARNKEIAAVLVISEFTVKRHVQNILEKLELPSRGAAAVFYRLAFESEPPSANTGARG
jgi:DNA-binding NarL/FixJ family response regulator